MNDILVEFTKGTLCWLIIKLGYWMIYFTYKYFYADQVSGNYVLPLLFLSEMAINCYYTEQFTSLTNYFITLTYYRSIPAVIPVIFEKVFHRIWLKFVGGILTTLLNRMC